MTKCFEFIVEKKHIEIQENALTYQGSNIFRASCELPEYHQCEIDHSQTLYPIKLDGGYRVADTIHNIIGVCDYKADSIDGVFLSKSTRENINSGIIDAIVVWSWVKKPSSSSILQIGQTLSYKIKGWIDAKEALDLLDKTTNRFKYTKLNVL